jgi:hypothetical protein
MAFSLNRVFQKYFSNLFVSVVRYGSEWQVYAKVIKNGSLTKKFSKAFPVAAEDSFGEDVEEYIENLYNNYNYVYISYLLDSMGQGAIFGTKVADFEKNSVDIKNVTQVIIDKKWSLYASFIDINWTKNLFKNCDLDFVYSPFILIYFLILDTKNSKKPVLYILNHEDFVAICVFRDKELLFGSFFKTSTDENLVAGDEVSNWEEEEEQQGVDNLIELDSIDDDSENFNTLEELEDFENLEDFDAATELQDTFEDTDEIEKTLGHFGDEEDLENNLEIYGRDMLVYKYLNSSVKEYYKNNIYESDFIEKLVLFDGYEISPDLIEMIEGELMMDIELHKINIGEKVCDLSIKEAKI